MGAPSIARHGAAAPPGAVAKVSRYLMSSGADSAKRRLVIVESPAKARTIAGYLGDGFSVESSVGHIRDLPERASDIPKEERGKYGALGVAIDEGFEPYYVVDPDKKKIVAELRRKLKDSDELLLATDEDREGEAIAHHLVEALKPKVPVRRMVFHEITKEAILRALEETREIDRNLVDAQETRRILDRLYGYEVSPVLWKKVTRGLSAGRVQSVATRLVVERERERMRFVAARYWDVLGSFDPGSFEARLAAVDGRRVAQGRDFGPDGQPARSGRRPGRGAREAARPRSRGAPIRRAGGGRNALHAAARGAVPHLDAPAGGRPQAPLHLADDDARCPAPLRERLHHLHAHRLGGAVRDAPWSPPAHRQRRSMARRPSRSSRDRMRARWRTPRKLTKQSARRETRFAHRRRCRSWGATSGRSTS